MTDADMLTIMQKLERGTAMCELSRYKTAQWTHKGEILVVKKNAEGFGGYRIFIHPEAVKGILEQEAHILESMEGVKSGLFPNPSNIQVALPENQQPRIVQVSVYNDFPKFGIHMLDQYGMVMVSKGLNFSPEEFCELLKFIKFSPKKEVPQLTFPVVKYSWKWKVAAHAPTNRLLTPITNGQWYVCKRTCLEEAEESRPSGDYVPEFTSSMQHLAISEHFVDAAVARLIIANIEDIKTELIMNNRLADTETLFETDLIEYSAEAMRAITIPHVVSICINAMSMNEKPSGLKIAKIMSEVLKRGVSMEALQGLREKSLLKEYVDLFVIPLIFSP